MAISRAWGSLRPVRLPLLVRCLGVFSAVPLGLSMWPDRALGPLDLAASNAEPIVGQAIVTLAGALYLYYWIRVWPRQSVPLVGSLVAAMALLAASGHDLTRGVSDDLWIYVVIIAGCGLPARISLPVIGLLAVLPLFLPGPTGLVTGGFTNQGNVSGPLQVSSDAPPLSWLLFVVAMTARALPPIVIGCAAAVLTFLGDTNAELRTAQTKPAGLAVDEEPACLSRDPHGLHGDDLSLTALKPEVTTHLLDQAEHPLPTLASELDGARIVAQAAAIDLLIDSERAGVLAPDVEAVCAWIVHEGMTNVVKHSRARRCRLRIEQHGCTVWVVVADDGRGGWGGSRGSGLKGLGERIAALGGALRVRPRGGVLGGFQLAARLPASAGDAAS